MTPEKEALRRKTERHYMAVVFGNGIRAIRYDRRKRIIFFSAALAVVCPSPIPAVLSRINKIQMRLSRCYTICGVSSCKLSDFTTIYSVYALFSVFSATLAVVCPSLTPLVLSRRNKTLTVAKISLISSARLAWLMYIKSILSLSCGSVL